MKKKLIDALTILFIMYVVGAMSVLAYGVLTNKPFTETRTTIERQFYCVEK